MTLFLDCYPCILRQVLSTARLAGLEEERVKEVLCETMRRLLDASAKDSPQHITFAIFEFLRRRFLAGREVFDPYAELKRHSNDAVLAHFDRLEASVIGSSSPLEIALKHAAAGNIIDFGAKDHGSIDIDQEIEIIPSLRFAHYDFLPLKKLLSGGGHLLYVGDNAGEIVFDRILIRQVRRQFPDMKVTFATRGQPIINDVTIEDALRVGMDADARVVSSGCVYPGLLLDEADEGFQELFRRADVIIAKGQGNYEGLSGVVDPRLFFILRTKCERVARDIGAEVGALVLLRKSVDGNH